MLSELQNNGCPFAEYVVFFLINHSKMRKIMKYVNQKTILTFHILPDGFATRKMPGTASGAAQYDTNRQNKCPETRVFSGTFGKYHSVDTASDTKLIPLIVRT